MEASVKAAEVVLPPDVTECSLVEEEETAACTPFSPMDEFRRRLDEIVSSYGNGPSVLEQQSWVESDMDKKKEEDHGVTVETEVSLIVQSLSQLSTPEEKLQELVKKYAEMASLRRNDEQKMCLLQHKFSRLLDERQLLQKEQRNNLMARSKLEALCRELQREYTTLRDETIERCREDEKKRNEMTSHFQEMLTEIQAQIEQHNTRNDKLCKENNSLTEKLEGLMNQCELREESLEKINKHRDLQQKLTEARLAQANALLVEAEEKHKREKEYLLREAIDKTKKCYNMKEQELSMKKKLALYAQKFDEFQATLAKSNEIFHRFKKEMDTMSEKMKKMEKESNLWKTRFENCNKALTDMLEERTEKGKEYDVFVLKIQKLEKLCRALQEERKILYDKIKDVRRSNAEIPSRVFGLPPPDSADNEGTLTTEDIEEMQSQDPVLTNDMARLKEEQAKLQLFAESLFDDNETEEDIGELDLEEDVVASAFSGFKTKKESADVKPTEEVKSSTVDEPKQEKVEENVDKQEEAEPCPKETTQEKPKDDGQIATKAEQEMIEEKTESSPVTEHKTEKVDEQTPEIPKVEEVKVEATVQEEKTAKVMVKPQNEAASSSSVSENSSEAAKKQAPKKKKKRNNKTSS